MKYTAIIEKTSTGYSAYLPDVPGCVATGRTLSSVRRNIEEALRFHLEGLHIEGEPLPVSSSKVETLDIPRRELALA